MGTEAVTLVGMASCIVKSVCCVPETNVTLCGNYTQMKKKKEKKNQMYIQGSIAYNIETEGLLHLLLYT